MAAEDVDIFEEDLRSMVNEPFTMPRESMRSEQSYGEGSGSSVSIEGTPGVDQVFNQVMFSPTFRSVVRVEDLPPETVGQAKEIFEYLAKTQGVNNAAQYLLEQFGQVTETPETFPIRQSIGPDPREQRVSGLEQYSSAGFDQDIESYQSGGTVEDIDIFESEPSGVEKISQLVADGRVREAYAEFEELPLAQQLAVSVTPVVGDALAAYEVGEFGTRAGESISRGEPLGAAGNVALAGLAGLSFIPIFRALRAARPLGKAVASTSETIPGPTTGQLTGITDLPADVRTEYSRAIYSDPRTGEMLKRDPIYKALDMPQRDVFEGQGFYKDEFNPVFVSRPVPRVKKDATGIERIDPRDAKTIEQRDTTFGYLTQQEGTPTSRVLTKTAPGTNDTIKITTKAEISQPQFAKIAKEAGKYGLDPVSIPEGITFFNNKSFDVLEDLSPEVVEDLTGSIEEILGPTAIRRVDRGNFDSINYSDFSEEFARGADEIADTSSLATKKLFESLSDEAIAKLDKSPEVRRFVTNKLEQDLEIARKQDLPIRKDIRTALTIISDQGFAGLKKVMEKGDVILPGIVFLYLGKAIPMVSSETQQSEA
jgi:hypothetical protein